MTDEVTGILHSLDAFRNRLSANQDRLDDIAEKVTRRRDQPVNDPQRKFVEELVSTEAQAAKVERDIADVELMLELWLSARSKSDPTT